MPADLTMDAWLQMLPGSSGLSFWPPPAALYSVARLYHGFRLDDPASVNEAWDTQVYRWTLGPDLRSRPFSPVEIVATRLHDAAMDGLVRAFLKPESEVTIGFMGGHDIERTAVAYARVARIARELRLREFNIVTGGGPGLMEAANFGAFMAPFSEAQFVAALTTLRREPTFGTDPDREAAERRKAGWIRAAAEVRESLLGRWDAPEPEESRSLGIPTWYYGHEPPNLFATASAKYFVNSVREDGLVSVANGGLLFGKGSAGTVQEVFQNASYNYYRRSDVDATPMVFLDVDFWDPNPKTDAAAGAPLDEKRKPVYPLVQKLASECRRPFTAQVMLSDDAEAITEFLTAQNQGRRKPARLADKRLASTARVRKRR